MHADRFESSFSSEHPVLVAKKVRNNSDGGILILISANPYSSGVFNFNHKCVIGANRDRG